ncbi:hypothetical protein AAVH_10278 [Aphelenchoides avenae]|nr:hypothetical protein AAVH_10278 [Aphelenchus avenae]
MTPKGFRPPTNGSTPNTFLARVKRQFMNPMQQMFGAVPYFMNMLGGMAQMAQMAKCGWRPCPPPRPPRPKNELVQIVKALPPGSTVTVERLRIHKARPRPRPQPQWGPWMMG